MRNGVDERVEVECRKVRVLCLNEHNIGHVVPKQQKHSLVVQRVLL